MRLTAFLFSTFLFQFGMAPIYGQIRFSAMDLSSTDSLQKSTIRYFSPGKGGRNRVWDFSKKLSSRESSQVLFMKDSLGAISVAEQEKVKYYRTSADTLILTGSESLLEKRDYVREKVCKLFPLEFNDSIRKVFRCDGVYCGKHPFREVGTNLVKVDAEGSIVLAENDTLKHVKRVHTIDTYSVCMDMNVESLDTAKLTQVIDEHYEWYLPEAEYPIIETFTSTTYLDMEIVGTTKCAYCNLTEDLAAYYITEDDGGSDTEELDNSFDNAVTEPDIIHYKIDIHDGMVTVKYDLDEDATISIIVASHMGITYRHNVWTQSAGTYSPQIDCSGLRSGTYILYINVNGKIYSEKVSL